MWLTEAKTKKPAVWNGRLCCMLLVGENLNWRAREESNLNLSLRRAASYPLDHGRKLYSKSYYRG